MSAEDERWMREQFPLDDADGPAPPIGREGVDALTASVLAAWKLPPSGGDPSGGAGPTGSTTTAGAVPTGTAAPWIGFGAALAVAIAIGGYVGLTRHGEDPPPEAPVAVPTVDTPVVEEQPPAVIAEPAELEPIEEADAPRAEDLLARANALRAERRFAAAERIYQRVARTRGRAAQVGALSAASLRLGPLDDPGGALALYRRAAARPGPLRVEARFGEAQALRRLGRTNEEARALRAVVRDGRGPTAAAARVRLTEIEGQ